MRYVITALVIGAVVGTAGAQVTIETANLQIPGYYDKLKKIVDEQIIGYRTVAEKKTWDTLRPGDGQPVGIHRPVAVHSKDLWVSRVANLSPGGGGKESYVHILTPDASYGLQLKPSGGTYRVNGHRTEWGDPQGYRNTVALFTATVQLFQPREVTEVLETINDEYEGRPTLRITARTRQGAKLIGHVDRTTYQHLYSESDKVLDYKKRGYVDGKSVAKTEYRSEGGRLWPTRHEAYQVTSDGKKQPVSETTFVEYAPYTATADELDMEKQFGVKPIPHEPRPESARVKRPGVSRQVWLFGAAGVLAAAAALVVLVRRRRPAASA